MIFFGTATYVTTWLSGPLASAICFADPIYGTWLYRPQGVRCCCVLPHVSSPMPSLNSLRQTNSRHWRNGRSSDMVSRGLLLLYCPQTSCRRLLAPSPQVPKALNITDLVFACQVTSFCILPFPLHTYLATIQCCYWWTRKRTSRPTLLRS